MGRRGGVVIGWRIRRCVGREGGRSRGEGVVVGDSSDVGGGARDHVPCTTKHLRVIRPLEESAMANLFIFISLL